MFAYLFIAVIWANSLYRLPRFCHFMRYEKIEKHSMKSLQRMIVMSYVKLFVLKYTLCVLKVIYVRIGTNHLKHKLGPFKASNRKLER